MPTGSGEATRTHVGVEDKHLIWMSSLAKPVTFSEKTISSLAVSRADPVHVHLRVVIEGGVAAAPRAFPVTDGATSVRPSRDGSSARTPTDGIRNAQITAAAMTEREGKPG